MPVPKTFIVSEPFSHKSPELIRKIASHYGFICRTIARSAVSHDRIVRNSEIWVKPGDLAGYWCIRIDGMGHGQEHFGSRPHYHKEWIESEPLLQKYLRESTRATFVYSDSGQLLGQQGEKSAFHPDQKAKLQHIPR